MSIPDFFKEPENKNVRIWRYMDFTRLVSLLDKQALFFPQGDLLRQNVDKFEGSLTKLNIEFRRQLETNYDLPQGLLDKFGTANRDLFGKILIINCWCMSDYESMAMWDLYMTNGNGVAVQTTYNRLSECLNPPDEIKLYFGKVNYVDYTTTPIPEINVLAPFTHKRKSYEFEQEIRAIGMVRPNIFEDVPLSEIAQGLQESHGIYIPVDLQRLVENIYVSPKAPRWFQELVESIVVKYGLGNVVVQSDLCSDPIY